MLPDTTVLNAKTVMEIVKMGYTRIPVYTNGDKNNVTDLLFVKVGNIYLFKKHFLKIV